MHGVVGYTSRVPGTDQLLNALSWPAQVDAREWQPHQTAFARLASAGVHTTVVNKRAFVDSGLTIAGQRGAEYVIADRVGERLAAVLAASDAAPSLTYMYDGDLDWTGHKYGVASLQWRLQLSMIDAEAEHLREVLAPDVRVVVVADHGMLDSPPEHRIDVDDGPDLRPGVVLVGGEARFRHIYCRAGSADDVLATWRAVLGERAEVLSRDDALARGWFGTLLPHVRPRLGDVMVACRDDFAVECVAVFPHEPKLIGLHGSLTSAEMLIPILVA